MEDTGVGLESRTPLSETVEKPVCEQCGAEIDEELIECPRCGALIEDEVEESLMHRGDEIVYPEDVCNV